MIYKTTLIIIWYSTMNSSGLTLYRALRFVEHFPSINYFQNIHELSLQPHNTKACERIKFHLRYHHSCTPLDWNVAPTKGPGPNRRLVFVIILIEFESMALLWSFCRLSGSLARWRVQISARTQCVLCYWSSRYGINALRDCCL